MIPGDFNEQFPGLADKSDEYKLGFLSGIDFMYRNLRSSYAKTKEVLDFACDLAWKTSDHVMGRGPE